jgi:hypothetical protein
MKALTVLVPSLVGLVAWAALGVEPLKPLKIPAQWQTNTTPAVVASSPTQCLTTPLEVGTEGVSWGGKIRVIQVLSPNEMRGEVFLEVYERPNQDIFLATLRSLPRDKADEFLKNPPKGRKTGAPKEVMLVGIKTQNIADGETISYAGRLKVAGTKSYQTALGATRTLYRVEPAN